MTSRLPDWYHGWADAVLELRATTVSGAAFERSAWLRGYLAAIFLADRITTDERQRMANVHLNALHYALQNLKTPTHKNGAA